MRMQGNERKPISILLSVLILSSCATISLFDETAYNNAVSLKVESLALMDKAVEPFDNHREEVEELRLKIDIAYEYARGLPKNEISARQWEILKDPGRHLLGGFIKRWSEHSTLSSTFIEEAKGLVAGAFDTISGLESGKIKPKDVN